MAAQTTKPRMSHVRERRERVGDKRANRRPIWCKVSPTCAFAHSALNTDAHAFAGVSHRTRERKWLLKLAAGTEPKSCPLGTWDEGSCLTVSEAEAC